MTACPATHDPAAWPSCIAATEKVLVNTPSSTARPKRASNVCIEKPSGVRPLRMSASCLLLVLALARLGGGVSGSGGSRELVTGLDARSRSLLKPREGQQPSGLSRQTANSPARKAASRANTADSVGSTPVAQLRRGLLSAVADAGDSCVVGVEGAGSDSISSEPPAPSPKSSLRGSQLLLLLLLLSPSPMHGELPATSAQATSSSSMRSSSWEEVVAAGASSPCERSCCTRAGGAADTTGMPLSSHMSCSGRGLKTSMPSAGSTCPYTGCSVCLSRQKS
jgi:hypothetical protein